MKNPFTSLFKVLKRKPKEVARPITPAKDMPLTRDMVENIIPVTGSEVYRPPKNRSHADKVKARNRKLNKVQRKSRIINRP